MKVNLEQVLTDKDGNPRPHMTHKVDAYQVPLLDSTGQLIMEYRGPFLMRDALYTAVNAVYKEETPAPAEVYARGKLARRIYSGGEKNFSSEDITKLCNLVAKRYMGEPLLVLQIVEILDPDNKDVKEAAEPSTP